MTIPPDAARERLVSLAQAVNAAHASAPMQVQFVQACQAYAAVRHLA